MNRGEPVKHAYVSGDIIEAPSCHLTFAINARATTEEVDRLREATDKLNYSVFPCIFELGNFSMCGDTRTLPVYKCVPIRKDLLSMFERFYREHYKNSGGRLYPQLKFHVTVDTPEKLVQMESLETGTFTIQAIRMTTRLSEPQAVAAATAPAEYYAPPVPSAPKRSRVVVEDSNQWSCRSCGWDNNMSKKECRNSECGEWRPKELMPRRAGDWNCPSCNDMQFGRNTRCRRCHTPKP